MITFKSENHHYSSNDDTVWVSVTTFIERFHPKFDSMSVAKKVTRIPSSKWYRIPPEEIVRIWDAERDRSIVVGSWLHNKVEREVLMFDTMQDLSIVPSIIDDEGVKIAPDQKLEEGIYPEHMMYLPSLGICGQSDLVMIRDGKVYIKDLKTNKQIKTRGYVDKKGKEEMMFAPINHLPDCNFTHYSLQLSMYMYMVLKHNPHLEVGGIEIQHVLFEKLAEDEYGFPILVSEDDQYIVKEVVTYKIPYLYKEVFDMLKTHTKETKNGKVI